MVSEAKKKQLKKQYNSNESKNYHTENAIMLIKVFGTKGEKNKATRMKKLIDKQGYITREQSDWLYNHGHIHYNKL